MVINFLVSSMSPYMLILPGSDISQSAIRIILTMCIKLLSKIWRHNTMFLWQSWQLILRKNLCDVSWIKIESLDPFPVIQNVLHTITISKILPGSMHIQCEDSIVPFVFLYSAVLTGLPLTFKNLEAEHSLSVLLYSCSRIYFFSLLFPHYIVNGITGCGTLAWNGELEFKIHYLAKYPDICLIQ